MEEIEYLKHYQLEKNHWWFKSRWKIVFNLLAKHLPQHHDRSILDAGCGTGMSIKKLRKFGEVTGIDSSPWALQFCRKKDLASLILGSINNMPLYDASFDVVTCFGVLYHKRVNDRKAISEFYRVLQDGGVLLITTPAVHWLRSRAFRTYHDFSMHTGRRHSKKDMQVLLQDAGFQVKKISYFMTFLFLPVLLFRVSENIVNKIIRRGLAKESEISMIPKVLNDLLEIIMLVEALIIQRISLPFGVSLVIVAEKPIRL